MSIERNEYAEPLPSEPPIDASYGPEPEVQPEPEIDHVEADLQSTMPSRGTQLEHPSDRTISDREFMIGVRDTSPHNVDAELTVLGSILTHNEAIYHCPNLKPEHFFFLFHQRIFKLTQDMLAKGDSVSPVTLMHHLTEADREECKKTNFIVKLVQFANFRTSEVATGSRIVIEMFQRRLLMCAAERVANDPDNTVGDMQQILGEALQHVTQGQMVRKMRDGRAVTTSLIERLSKPQRRTSTGLARLDAALGGGLARGQAYGFMAEYGNGKTMLAGTISQNLDKASKRHLFIAAEMGDEEIHARSLARDLGISYQDIEADDVPASILSEAAYIGMQRESSVIYQSEPFLTFDTLKQLISSAVATKNIEGVILDYWQLVRGWKPGHKTEHLDEVADWIAAAAKAFDIWIVVMGQLNREGNVRGGDGAQMAFSNVFFLHREDKTEPWAWLEAKKVRHTRFMHVGSKDNPAFEIVGGTHFRELDESYSPSIEAAVKATEKKADAAKKKDKTGGAQKSLLPEKEGE